MGNTHLDRSSGSSALWLARWEEIINKAEEYKENLLIWLQDICLVWEQVPDLVAYFSNIKLSFQKHALAEYTSAEISSSIQFHWEHQKQRLTLKSISKSKATRSAFASQGVILNGKKVSQPQPFPMSRKLELMLLKSSKTHQKKVRSEKIKTIIKVATTLTKVARAIETNTFAFKDLIVQQIDKNATSVPGAAVCHTISANAILL